ncbi:hypothetical protein ACJ72_01585 [Emergomyces africanus]|uniref:Alpha-1,3-mannosyltransferase CMT1 n=1 Tax=Emergomyces africanus TaxID=1955775 RepID=A0A1B7P4V1_9EURO|nr:hypothetical protein ACJ72_01585 [Emergomyces africanus]
MAGLSNSPSSSGFCNITLEMNRQLLRHLQQFLITIPLLFLIVYIYSRQRTSSSSASNDIQIKHNIGSCGGFNPANVSDELNSIIGESRSRTNQEIHEFVCSIMNHDMSLTAKLDCPVAIDQRYRDLRIQPVILAHSQIQFYFALDLHQAVHIILPLMGAIMQVIRHLGPEYCALSIVEGRSTDGTYEILTGLTSELKALGVPYFLSQSSRDPLAPGENRITALAELRNKALQPLFEGSARLFSRRRYRISSDAIVIFLNDIVLCPEDILELVYQHRLQSASMTCAFDWNGQASSFYDSWVSRSMSGNLFFEISHDAQHWLAKDMFFDDPPSAARYEKLLPLQVYSCWGGMVTLDAAPFIKREVSFRSSAAGECYMGEPTLLGKDLWRIGRGKILAVPSVNVAYEYVSTREAKDSRGYVHNIVHNSTTYLKVEELVKWQKKPPPVVKCMPIFNQQWWVDSL